MRITRRYGDVVANDGLDLSVGSGEVVALLGENGAGKSTFLSILAGLTAPEGGEIRIDGRPKVFRRPADAIASGVGTVFQHFALVPVFTVREQLRLAGADPNAPLALLDGIDRGQRVSDLSVGERQRVEIARVLAQRPRLLLLDEPTSTLTGPEVDRVFDLVDGLRADGVAVVFVTHRLPEALRLADRIVVIRRGRIVDDVIGEGSADRRWPLGVEERLLGAMFAEPADGSPFPAVSVAVAKPAFVIGEAAVSQRGRDALEPVLRTHAASARTGYGRHRPIEITIALRAGTTFGVVGIDGQGQRELAEMLAGHLAMSGRMTILGQDVSRLKAAERQRLGVGFLTSDRTGEGGLPGLPVGLNLILKRQRQPAFQHLGVLRTKAIQTEANRLVAEWGIGPLSADAALGGLSGGNLQKVLLAREMELAPKVLIASNPSQGLDWRTQQLVWAALRRVTDTGGVVVLLTPDVTEALARADEIAVLSAGRLSPPVPVAETDQGAISRQMVSGW